MTKDDFRAWLIRRGYTPEGAISNNGGCWAKGVGESYGKGHKRYILLKTLAKCEKRAPANYSRWEPAGNRIYKCVIVDENDKLTSLRA